MQSYLDLTLICIIGGAVGILLLLLVSFILCQRRINDLENELFTTKELNNNLQNKIDSLLKHIASQDTKITKLDSTLNFFKQSHDDFIDKFKDLDNKLNSVNLKQERQNIKLNEQEKDSSVIMEAKKLFALGYSLDEVQQKVPLTLSELEMLKSVSDKETNTNHVASSLADLNIVSNSDVQSNINTDPPKKTHIASLRARNAYGISRGASLKR